MSQHEEVKGTGADVCTPYSQMRCREKYGDIIENCGPGTICLRAIGFNVDAIRDLIERGENAARLTEDYYHRLGKGENNSGLVQEIERELLEINSLSNMAGITPAPASG